ncbi:MAG: hypothetical protein LRY67_06365 [Gammaproteobacteria bacterium]|nr:hypothetical protein [Gammaproteobacteria bacterium]
MRKEFLIALAGEILPHLSWENKEVIIDIKLSILFEQIYSILKGTVVESKRFSDKPRVMVLGRTRVGKSVVMGHLLGHPLAMSEIQGALRVEYSNEHFAGRRPKIGHKHASETKGAFLYDNDASSIDCIDCAGVLDIEHSVETDICNALSVSMMVKRRKPTAIVVVMPSAWITDTGMVDFLETIQRLKRILPSDHRVWSSVIFILNDHTLIPHPVKRRSFLSADEIKANVFRQMNIKIAELRADLDKLRPTRGIAASLWNAVTRNLNAVAEEADWRTGISETELHASLDENRIIQINRIIDEIRLLERLLQYQDNFVVTDFESGKNIKEEVLQILQNRTRLSLFSLAEQFTVERFYEDRTSNIQFKFQIILEAVVDYFYEHCKNEKIFNESFPFRQLIIDLIETFNLGHYIDHKKYQKFNRLNEFQERRISREASEFDDFCSTIFSQEDTYSYLGEDIAQSIAKLYPNGYRFFMRSIQGISKNELTIICNTDAMPSNIKPKSRRLFMQISESFFHRAREVGIHITRPSDNHLVLKGSASALIDLEKELKKVAENKPNFCRVS